MTDKQIIEALNRCGHHTECCYCNSVEECGSKRNLVKNISDLINRQKAEIERLNEKYSRMKFNLESVLAERADHTEAVKEFAERLCDGRVANDPVIIAVKAELKEMGENQI